jgi:hypothetical protein
MILEGCVRRRRVVFESYQLAETSEGDELFKGSRELEPCFFFRVEGLRFCRRMRSVSSNV